MLQSDNDKRNFDKIVESLKDSRKGRTLGVIAKDQQYKGSFMDAWRAHWAKQQGLKTTDMAVQMTYVMAPKADTELANVKKASQITSEVFSTSVRK